MSGYREQFPITREMVEAQDRSRMARAAEDTARTTDGLLDAMKSTLELNRQAQDAAKRTENFTRIMAWSSLGVSIASLGAAVAAIAIQH